MSTGYYVSVVDGRRRGLLLGPYPTQADADANVDRARSAAQTADRRAHFYGFGTARVQADALPDGLFNGRIHLWPSPARVDR